MFVDKMSVLGLARKVRGGPNRSLARTISLLSAQSDYARAMPVLCNSLPKSGTHLLLQILRALPGTRYFNGFIASVPTRPYRERTLSKQVRMINRVAPREVMPAHLFYHPVIEMNLSRKHFIHFFIYRDPRDVIISDMHHVTYRVPYHGLHSLFVDECSSDDERITLAIKGAPTHRKDIEFPDIAARVERYKRWITHPDVLSVRFEELRGDSLPDLVRKIVLHYVTRSNQDVDVEAAVSASLTAIAPARSPTFRTGETGQWRKIMTDQQRRLVKEIAGSILIELGYEKDWDW